MADGLNALPAVFAAISAWIEDVGRDGIAKDRRKERWRCIVWLSLSMKRPQSQHQVLEESLVPSRSTR